MTKHKPGKEMLINTVEGQECRIALVRDGHLEELYVERTASASHVGSIYKGRITNVEPAIQAAFVDTGLGRNGFLHVSDVNPSYFPKGKKTPEKVGRKRPHYVRPPIQECLRRGQEVVVQMTKEGIGTKGPTMTTYLSIPGRLLVMMPGMTRLGVSRKVEDDGARGKARQALSELKLPQDMGFIVRTAGVDRSRRDLQRDLNYLLRLWNVVKERIKSSRAPVELYRESDLVTRTIRDVYDSEIERVVCDSEAVARRVEELLNVAVPRTRHTVELYTGRQGLFYDSGLEDEIEKIHARRVELGSGGSVIIDQAEALVAIDVNSGRYRQHADAETTALKINVEAAEEIVRQLRLRDLGGVIIIDFIDMRGERNRRTLEKTLRDAIKRDRAKTKVLRTSAFGIIELTRQRLGPSLKQSVFRRCSYCDGMGVIRTEESLSLLVMRKIQRACAEEHVAHIHVSIAPPVANYLNNHQRREIGRLEAETGKTIVIRADVEIGPGNSLIRCTNSRGTEVAWEHPAAARPDAEQLSTVSIQDVPPPAAKAANAPAAEAQAPPPPPKAPPAAEPLDQPKSPTTPDEAAPERKKSRRGRRGGRKHRRLGAAPAEEASKPGPPDQPQPMQETPEVAVEPQAASPEAHKRTRRKRRRSKHKPQEAPAAEPQADNAAHGPAEATANPQEPKTGPAEPAKPADAKEEPAPDAPPSQPARQDKPAGKKPRRRAKRARKPATPLVDLPGDDDLGDDDLGDDDEPVTWDDETTEPRTPD